MLWYWHILTVLGVEGEDLSEDAELWRHQVPMVHSLGWALLPSRLTLWSFPTCSISVFPEFYLGVGEMWMHFMMATGFTKTGRSFCTWLFNAFQLLVSFAGTVNLLNYACKHNHFRTGWTTYNYLVYAVPQPLQHRHVAFHWHYDRWWRVKCITYLPYVYIRVITGKELLALREKIEEDRRNARPLHPEWQPVRRTRWAEMQVAPRKRGCDSFERCLINQPYQKSNQKAEGWKETPTGWGCYQLRGGWGWGWQGKCHTSSKACVCLVEGWSFGH